jgi:GTP-binding protein
MVIYTFKNAKFVKSGTKPAEYPTIRDPGGAIMPEIAVAGRSNVGKSSLLNHLFQSKGLVKTSSVPGKTQLLNFFNLNDQLAFVDLPGYGYAKVPAHLRKLWGPMIQMYLEKRESLKLILFLFDIRRMPNEDDRILLDWIIHNQKAMILVFTKVDKVKLNEKKANTQKILAALNVDNLHYTHYSATKNQGRKELMHMIIDAMKDESEAEAEVEEEVEAQEEV